MIFTCSWFPGGSVQILTLSNLVLTRRDTKESYSSSRATVCCNMAPVRLIDRCSWASWFFTVDQGWNHLVSSKCSA